MEFLVVIFSVIAIVLWWVDGNSAMNALDSKIARTDKNQCEPVKSIISVIYVFARWQPSSKIKMDLPTVYYIPCNNMGMANRLAEAIKVFGTKEECIVDLPDFESLKRYIAQFYQLNDFDLTMFPIPTYKLLRDMD